MIIHHKFPWKSTQYGQTMFVQEGDIDALRNMTTDDYEEMANAAVAAEAAYIAMNRVVVGTTGTMAEEAAWHGAGAQQLAPPQYNPPPSAAQTGEVCPVCGAPGQWKNAGKTGKRVLECTNPQHKNDKGYAYSIRWA